VLRGLLGQREELGRGPAGSERGARSWTPVVGTPLQLTGRGRRSWALVVGTGSSVVDAGRGPAGSEIGARSWTPVLCS